MRMLPSGNASIRSGNLVNSMVIELIRFSLFEGDSYSDRNGCVKTNVSLYVLLLEE